MFIAEKFALWRRGGQERVALKDVRSGLELVEEDAKRGGILGVFNWPVRLESMDGKKSLEIEAMVDTGAIYTVVPSQLLNELDISPIDKITLVLPDGRPVERDLGRARATICGRSISTLVVFGPDDTHSLLGAYTLDGLRLAVDPTHGRVIPVTTAYA